MNCLLYIGNKDILHFSCKLFACVKYLFYICNTKQDECKT